MVASVLRRILASALLLNLFIYAVTAAPAPEVVLKTAQGDIRLADLRGQVVYVDFWASWCGPCRKSFPWMNAMQQRYARQGFKIVAINVDADPTLAKKFLAEHHAAFTVAYDSEGALAKQFKVMGMPSSYLIDRAGNVHATHIGFKEQDAADLEHRIKALLSN